MHLNKISLRDFRCFDSLDIDFHPRLTVLIAENGGGKTAVLDAIARGLSPVLRYLSSANQRLSGPGLADTDIRKVNDRTEGFAQVTVSANYFDGRIDWDVVKLTAQHKQPDKKIGQKQISDYATSLLDLADVHESRLIPVFAYYGARRGYVEVPARLRIPKNRNVNYHYPLSALHQSLDAESDFKEMLRWFDEEEISEFRSKTLNELLENNEKPSVSHKLLNVRQAIELLIGEQYEEPRFNERHKFVIKSKKENSFFQVSQLSQGYQSMLALAMDFARRLGLANEMIENHISDARWTDYLTRTLEKLNPDGMDNKMPKGPSWAPAIMLVDEIDLHLHPSWQQRVIGDLMRTFPCTQFIVTTHSPQVLTTVKRENIRVLGKNTAGKWEAVPPPLEIKGVESAVVLNSAMGVNPIPPVEEAKWLADYIAHVENGTHTSPDAITLYDQLLKLYGPNHPIMLDVDRLTRFQAFKLRKGSTPQS